jgi:hypothetical protein
MKPHRTLLLIAVLLPLKLGAALTESQVADEYLRKEMRKRIARGERCNCACQLDVTTLFKARVILRAADSTLQSIADFGKTVKALREKQCGPDVGVTLPANRTSSRGFETRNSRKPGTVTTYAYNLGANNGASGSHKMKLPELVRAMSTLDLKSRTMFFAELPPTIQAASVQWTESHRDWAAELLGKPFIDQSLITEPAAAKMTLYGLNWQRDEIPIVVTRVDTPDGDEMPPILKALMKVDRKAQYKFFQTLPDHAQTALTSWIASHEKQVKGLQDLAVDEILLPRQ